MHPEICTIGPLTIYSYGLLLALAFIVGSTLASLEARQQEINPEVIFNLSFLILVSGIFGARIFYITQNISYYLKNPLEIVMLQRGGLSWFGGLILGTTAAITYLKNKQLPIYKTLDLLVPFLALAQAIGRIGCLLNGCCFGRPSSFGLYFAVHGAVLIPTQVYSSLILICIFSILRFLQDRPHRAGEIFYAYLLLYSLKRFLIEFWRADNPVIIFGFTLFQIFSIAIFSIALIKLFLIKRSKT